MARIDWQRLPLEEVPVSRLVWPCHDLHPEHLHPEPDAVLSRGPLHVEQLADGSLYVHDGRHRGIRAAWAGRRAVAARVLRH